MKLGACLAAILVVCEAANPYLSLLEALSRGGSGVDFPEYSEKCSSGKIRECTSCETAKVCLPNGTPVASVNCTAFSPSTPFCSLEDGQCTENAPSSCSKASEGSFPCPSQDGVYPDPTDCTLFHYCAGGSATTVECPKNNVYDHAQGTCKLRHWSFDCVKFNCANKEGKYIVYPKDDRIYATCAAGEPIILGRCEDYESFNIEQNKCVRVCRTVENQPIKDECSSYIRCAEIGNGKLEPVKFPCPPGQGFDVDAKKCIKKTCPSDTDETVEEPEAPEDGAASRINSSGNNNSNNNVTDGNDDVNGNLVNGNNNGENSNTGNVGSGNQGRFYSRIINNSGSNNANNSVENGDDSVDGNLVNGNNNGNDINSGNIESGNQRIINNSGDNNQNNNIANGNDTVDGNLVNGNNNSNNHNSGNTGSGNQGRALFSRINNSGDQNSDNNVINGADDTNGNLVNGNNNSGNSNIGNVGSGNRAISRINNSGNDNANNSVENGDDNTNGNLVNGNGNLDNSNTGNVGSGNHHPGWPWRIINNSGDKNTGNNVTNGDDQVNGNLINGNDNGNNHNSGNTDSGNQHWRIINNSGDQNRGNNVINGDDEVNGTLINGNNNGNNANTGNTGSWNYGRLESRIINNSGNSNSDQSVINGNDKADGSVINGNNNGNSHNSNNVGSGNHQKRILDEDSASSSDESEEDNSREDEGNQANKRPPNLVATIQQLIEWIKNILPNRRAQQDAASGQID